VNAGYVYQVALVGLGGFVGSSLRFMLSGWVHNVLPFSGFPYGTLAVNVLGCLAIGVLGGLAELRQVLDPGQRLFLLIGVLGGFTTFSTFAYETLALTHGAEFGKALANIVLQIILSLTAAWLGYAIGRLA
jgi:CrcB protein